MSTRQRICLLLCLFLNIFSYAEDISAPTHKKKSNKKELIFEINGLISANQGIGLNSEIKLVEHMTTGVNLEYYAQTPFRHNETQALRNMINISPFLRYYLFSLEQTGFFLGIKFNFTDSQAQINDNEVRVEYHKFYIAPTTHFGYRFLANSGFTVSSYVGAGVKSISNKFPNSSLPNSRLNHPDWNNAIEKLNKSVSIVQPDYGLTIGYQF